MKKVLSIQWVSIIGGMCYSIYLLQFVIMSGASGIVGKLIIIHHGAGFLLYSGIIIVLVLCGSAAFYRLIERPCMRKDWYKRIFSQKKYRTVIESR
jgi:peptidoglycan/LPS O-acetylase OafA/YrhL